MNAQIFRDLVIETIRAPADAAGRLLAVDLPRNWLWMALALMCVLNAIVYSISVQINPPSPEVQTVIPPAFQSPVLFTIFLFGALVITIYVLQWISQAMSGTATVSDMLLLMTWLQVMRLIFQLAVLILSLVSTALSALLVIGGSIWAVYILAAFIDKANGFDNLLKALGVMSGFHLSSA